MNSVMRPEARYLVVFRKAIAGKNLAKLHVVTHEDLPRFLLEGWLVVFTDPLPNRYDDPPTIEDDAA